ncbi:hypothetical protein HK100_002685 [Physocladia obscura]|uniref:Homeobox domain-containing protein n=1 Tax=Physocladia obscura TaxID=109957 RepID=A0AAD5T7V7_9FUNG|nr:hypothetical protein HK100_002685 [Physocladia obscura]
MSTEIKIQDISRILDVTSSRFGEPFEKYSSPTMKGLTNFLEIYKNTRIQIAENVINHWNKSIALYGDGGVGALGDLLDPNYFSQGAAHAEYVAKIHKLHLESLIQTLTLFEYKAVLIVRYHASLIARVNQQVVVLKDEKASNERHAPFITRTLEASFANEQYVSRAERDRLRSVTGLTPVQIMIWFTNKRRRGVRN